MASGNTLAIWTVLGSEPPAANAATLDTRNQHVLLDYDATTAEYAVLSAVMPRSYGCGGLTVYYHVAFSSAVAGTAAISGEFERIGNRLLDIDADSFAAASTGYIGAPSTSGIVRVASDVFAHGAAIDGILPGEGFRFKVGRQPADGADNATGDVELRFLELRET